MEPLTEPLDTRALRELERAEYVRNADKWIGDRNADADYHVQRAQAYATLSLALQVARKRP